MINSLDTKITRLKKQEEILQKKLFPIQEEIKILGKARAVLTGEPMPEFHKTMIRGRGQLSKEILNYMENSSDCHLSASFVADAIKASRSNVNSKMQEMARKGILKQNFNKEYEIVKTVR